MFLKRSMNLLVCLGIIASKFFWRIVSLNRNGKNNKHSQFCCRSDWLFPPQNWCTTVVVDGESRHTSISCCLTISFRYIGTGSQFYWLPLMPGANSIWRNMNRRSSCKCFAYCEFHFRYKNSLNGFCYSHFEIQYVSSTANWDNDEISL